MKKFSLMAAALAAIGLARADIQPITGTNTVGFVTVDSPTNANTIITVPFEACLGEGASGMLADLVATNGLTSDAASEAAADQLVVLTTNGATQVYYYYWYKTGEGWTAITSSMLMPDGSSQSVSPPAATNFALARGLGFWLKRVAGADTDVYLKGQVSEAGQSTEIRHGLNLVGYGTVATFSLNSLTWSNETGCAYGSADGDTAKSDQIIVANADGTFSTYYYFVQPGGEAWSGYSALNNKWITSSFQEAGTPIAAGRGFWYLRRAAGSFNFMPDGN